MSDIHPSRWTIKYASTAKFCQTRLLPLGPDEAPYQISTKLFNKIYEEWGENKKSNLVCDFAQALRELRIHQVNLGQLPQVNPKMANACYEWLDKYEAALVAYGIKRQQEDKALTAPQPLTTQEAAHKAYLYDQLLTLAVKEYIIMAGPMGDAKLIAEKAKAVAKACVEG